MVILLLPDSRWPSGWDHSTARQLDLALHLFLIQNLIPQTFTTINGVYWSLAIEFQLYLLFPLLLLIVSRIGWQKVLVVVGFVELVSRLCLTFFSYIEVNLFPSDWWGWLDLSPFGFWFSWTLGAYLADAFVEKKKLPFARGPLPLWTWPLIVLLVFYTPGLRNFTFPIAAFGAVRFLSFELSQEQGHHEGYLGPISRILSFTGIISYSLYLLHQPLVTYILSFRPRAFGRASVYGLEICLIVFSLVFTFAASYVLFRFVETPGISLGKWAIGWIRSPRDFPERVPPPSES